MNVNPFDVGQPNQLVDHYFRHELARLVAALARRLGMRHLPLADDAVQVALTRALSDWSMRGIPEDPTGWPPPIRVTSRAD